MKKLVRKTKLRNILLVIVPVLVGGGVAIVMATSNPNTWTDGLVAYWSFDGQNTTSTNGTRDTSGNNNWGIFSGGVDVDAGVSGQALKFDGVDDYVNISDSDSLDFTDTLAIEAWINFDNVTQTAGGHWGSHMVLTKRYYWDENGYTLFVHKTGASFAVGYTGTANSIITVNGTANLNGWHHIVATYNRPTMKIYLDGYQLGSNGSCADAVLSNIRNIRIGDIDDYDEFNGLIDEVRIYNRALSADEVKMHYEQTRRNLKANQPSGAPPVGWWNFDEGSGSIAGDNSVNNNTGILYGQMATSTTSGWTDGKIGKALKFDGVDDYINAGQHSVLAVPGTITIATWLKWNGNNGKGQEIVSNFCGWSGYLLSVEEDFYNYSANQKVNFAVNLAPSRQYYDVQSNTQLTTNTWYYVVATYDSNQLNIYINGVLDNYLVQGSSLTPASYGSYPLMIGATTYGTAGTKSFNGLIDDVRIYNYARTAEQIAADYRAGAYRTTVATSNPNNWSDGLVGYWNFDGQNTTSTNGTRDVSGNNNWCVFNNDVQLDAGISGQALSFDGYNDYLNCGTGLSLGLSGKTGITFDAWLKLSSFSGETVVQRGGQGNPGFYWSMIYGQTGYFQYNTVGGYVGAQTTRTLPIALNTFFHYVVSVDLTAQTVSWYVNGNFIETKPITGIQTNEWAVLLSVGNYYGMTTTWDLSGLMDELRIYNRALSADEVKMHYEQTRRNIKI